MQKYPCIGQWSFLMTRTPALPSYRDLVARLKAGASILDVGCCFGQDLRHLAADGAPTERMYASDIIPEFWDLSYDLYRDASHMKARFISADILDPASPLNELRGKMDIILANQVFHLFDWEQQVAAGKNMVALSRAGTWLLGYQIGSSVGRAVPNRTKTGGKAGTTGGTSKFYHTPETWQELWRQIERETGTEWVVEGSIRELREWGWEDEDFVWMGPAARGLEFFARRVDASL